MYDHPSHGVLARLTVPGMVLSCGVDFKHKQKVAVTPRKLVSFAPMGISYQAGHYWSSHG